VLQKALAADFVSAFFSKYLPPENWQSLTGIIPDSLIAPLPSGLTPEQAFYEAGHLTGFKMLASSSGCSLITHWEHAGNAGGLKYVNTSIAGVPARGWLPE
jgi:hypothetical protein